MLLGIAVANITTAWTMFGSPHAGMFTMEPASALDRVVGVFNAMFIHQRGLPMFSTLLGYGIGMLIAREFQRGTPYPAARKLIAKRYAWLGVIGVVHVVFLFVGDILVFYSFVGLLFAWLMLKAKDRTLLWLAGVLYAVVVLGSLGLVAGELYLRSSSPETISTIAGYLNQETMSLEATSYLWVPVTGLFMFVMQFFGGFLAAFLMLGPVLLLGFVAGRRGYLSEISGHRRALIRITGIGFAVSILGGLFCGLMTMGLLGELPWLIAPHALSLITGLPGGVATIAAVALVCAPAQRKLREHTEQRARLPLPLAALQALGQRSLSGYLFQSVVFIVILPPFALGLMPHLSLATATLVAFGVWSISVVGAYLLARKNIPGPAERLHRRLTYGAPRRPSAP